MSTLLRLSRAQFLPVILSPVIVGTAAAWYMLHSLNWIFFFLALIGASLLHLASNVMNDVYDYTSGVDVVSDRSFPRDFPGWKVLPRGLLSIGRAKLYAYAFYAGGILIGLYFFAETGLPVLVLGILGILFSLVYTAPPLRIDYRGLALGEASIFVSFGPIPVLGAYYIQVRSLDLVPILASIPIGILTAILLMNHDLIFHDAYKEGGKRSLAVVLGRTNTAKFAAILSAACYPYLFLLSFLRLLPITVLSVLPALAVFLMLLRLYAKPNPQIPDYAKATSLALIHSLAFGLLLSAGLLLG